MPPTAPTPARYCRACGYNLQSLPTARCPECGRSFDPANPRTTLQRPRRPWLRRLKYAAVFFITLGFLLVSTWLWFYWGWHKEQQTVAQLNEYTYHESTSICPWLSRHLGPAGFVLDRVFRLELDFGAAPRPLTDIAANCTYLQVLRIQGSPADLSPLTRLHALSLFELTWSPEVKDLSPLRRLMALENIRISNTSVSDISSLAGHTNLLYLSIQDSPLSDLTPLATLTSLQDLSLYQTNVSDLSPLAGLMQLNSLVLSRTQAADLSPLARLPQLENLGLKDTKVTDLTPLAGLALLGRIDLDYTHVTDLSPLARLKNLYEIHLVRVPVTDLTPVTSPALRNLNLNDTKVKDISPLARLPHLENLDLQRTPVTDTSPLAKIKTLGCLSVSKKTIPETQVQALRKALPDCYIIQE